MYGIRAFFFLHKFIFSDLSIFIQTAVPADFESLPNINYLDQEFGVNETSFKKIPNNAIVILDDFSFKVNEKKIQAKLDFFRIVNYRLRHYNITLFLIIHNLYNNNLFNDILGAPHVFVSYTNLGFKIIR